ncbi:HNH endonuclease [Sphaerisporangium sp. NPDC051011]|uniref:HNH endonuclease n=1 Tax=Sphaerisporangium sp. NPDC051011 TaxID=3155792 RepID=UPI0033CE99C1
MIERDPQRFFSSTQRQILYLHAGGLCQVCGSPLDVDWHADHRIPWAAGGPTALENGQALCSVCNLTKGREMSYVDAFQPRPFQADVITQVMDGVRSGRDRTIVLASPGSGKTLAYLALGTRLFREGLIDNIAVFVPRVALAQQCEIDWMHGRPSEPPSGTCLLFDSTRRLGKIRHRVKELPLTFDYEPGSGFVSTYSALAINERIFAEWAHRHQGRFLLVADEAQFCGDSKDSEGGGTKAGALIEKLHGFAMHTLLLTGTPYRADNQPLVLAEYNDPKAGDSRGLRSLVRHAEATYADGIAERYLRTFELHLTNSQVTQKTLGDPADRMKGENTLTYNLSDNGEDLADVLRDPKTWEPLADRVVTKVRDKQKFNSSYRGLISCMGQNEAKAVQKYLQSKYPGLRVGIAVSSDTDAPVALADFKAKPMDVLVTVRMAFIGYDCPQITVVGILTHYRDGGHLMQLVGRGLRVWKDMPAREQSCVIVAPDDPKMKEFLSLLRGELDQGLRRVQERDIISEGGTAEIQRPLSYVESAIATTTRAASNDTDVESDELMLIESIKVAVDSAEDATKLVKFLDLYGIRTKQAGGESSPQTEPEREVYVEVPTIQVPKTDKELIEDYKSRTRNAITKYLAATGILPGAPGYQEAITRVTGRVNDACGYNATTANTVERAEKRLRAALALM